MNLYLTELFISTMPTRKLFRYGGTMNDITAISHFDKIYTILRRIYDPIAIYKDVAKVKMPLVNRIDRTSNHFIFYTNISDIFIYTEKEDMFSRRDRSITSLTNTGFKAIKFGDNRVILTNDKPTYSSDSALSVFLGNMIMYSNVADTNMIHFMNRYENMFFEANFPIYNLNCFTNRIYTEDNYQLPIHYCANSNSSVRILDSKYPLQFNKTELQFTLVNFQRLYTMHMLSPIYLIRPSYVLVNLIDNDNDFTNTNARGQIDLLDF